MTLFGVEKERVWGAGKGSGVESQHVSLLRRSARSAYTRGESHIKRLSIQNFLALKFTTHFFDITSKDHAV